MYITGYEGMRKETNMSTVSSVEKNESESSRSCRYLLDLLYSWVKPAGNLLRTQASTLLNCKICYDNAFIGIYLLIKSCFFVSVLYLLNGRHLIVGGTIRHGPSQGQVNNNVFKDLRVPLEA